MSKFRKKENEMQSVPTSALPDIIFILLFFFMVATKPIEQTKVDVKQPKASELQKLEKANLVSNIYIGKTKDSKGSKIQADDILITSDQIPQFIETEITYTEPGIKGDTATNTLKPATIESGAEIRVPLFCNEGDKVKVKTEDRSYQERVKN